MTYDDKPLIQLNEWTVVHPEDILEAHRCGNYTTVHLRTGGPSGGLQLWDPGERVWSAVKASAR